MPTMKTGLFQARQLGQGQEEDPVLILKREDTQKGDGKRHLKGTGPKDTTPSGRSNELICTHFQKGQCQKVACDYRHPSQNARTTNQKVDEHGGTRVYSSTQGKPVKKKWYENHRHKIGRDKGIQLCGESRTTDTEEHWEATNKEAVQSSILSQCRTRERERGKDHRKDLSSEGQK